MDGTNNPKLSFIPKGALVRDEKFFERSRPRSVMGILAGFAFVLSIGAYTGLYYYNNSLTKLIAEKTIEIKRAQKEFSDAPEVGEAKVFRARADLANQLLNTHTVASPVFAFLSKNTTESILYNNFSFKNEPDGSTIELSGEAPTYAALAYQVDVLRDKTKELSSFSVHNINLTSFGSITFSFSMTFARGYLLYTKNLSSSNVVVPQAVVPVPAIAPAPIVATPTATTTSKTPVSISPLGAQPGLATSTAGAGPAGNWTVAPRNVATTGKTATPAEKQSFLTALWSKLKFW